MSVWHIFWSIAAKPTSFQGIKDKTVSSGSCKLAEMYTLATDMRPHYIFLTRTQRHRLIGVEHSWSLVTLPLVNLDPMLSPNLNLVMRWPHFICILEDSFDEWSLKARQVSVYLHSSYLIQLEEEMLQAGCIYEQLCSESASPSSLECEPVKYCTILKSLASFSFLSLPHYFGSQAANLNLFHSDRTTVLLLMFCHLIGWAALFQKHH